MNFAWPHLLFLLIVPAGWLAWEAARGRAFGGGARPQILRADAGVHSVRLADPSESPFLSAGRSGPRFWLAAGLALGIVALARPQWGRIDEPMFNQSREVLIAIDLSRSMLTPDVTPSRIERSKLLVQSLLDRLAGERVGLVVFSGTAFLQSPLSADYEILKEFLPSLGPDFMPVGGTNYGALMDTAASAFSSGPGADRYMIVLSDGGATDDDWRSHIPALTDRGIRVIGLGIGTGKGALIPDGAGGFLKDESGAVVLSKLESDNLRELAAKTGGIYRDGSEWVDLAQLLKTTVEAGHKGKFVEKSSVRFAERFQWTLAPALICLLVGFWREFPVRPKPRDLRPRESGKSSIASTAVALLCLFILGSAREVLAGATQAEPSEPSPAPGVILGRMVGRLSSRDQPSALDWSEMAGQTISWGKQLQSSNETVPAGPVRDGLAAVDAGSAMDPKAADWPQLRAKLEELLKKSEEQKQNQQKQQQNQKPSNSGSSPQQERQNQPNQPLKPQNPNPQRQPASDGKKAPPQPPPTGNQQVGGRPENKHTDPAQADPNLAAPLQKLDQLRDQDAPAELFQMIENNEPRPPETKGKNW
jgi:Ca-activated chloride channel family protein